MFLFPEQKKVFLIEPMRSWQLFLLLVARTGVFVINWIRKQDTTPTWSSSCQISWVQKCDECLGADTNGKRVGRIRIVEFTFILFIFQIKYVIK